MNEIYITSDQHYSHRNILKYCSHTRGHIPSKEEMNEVLIQNHNDIVKPDDDVVMLGDFGWGTPRQLSKILERLNGTKYFVFGNHDKGMRGNPESLKDHFVWMEHYAELEIDGNPIMLSHYPMVTWNKKYHGAYQLYGHTHGKIPFGDGRSMDIGVDTNDLKPYNIRECFEILNNRVLSKEHAHRD